MFSEPNCGNGSDEINCDDDHGLCVENKCVCTDDHKGDFCEVSQPSPLVISDLLGFF